MKSAVRGFILFEVMIAIAVFAIVAVSLASAMNTTIQASNYLSRQAAIRHGLHGRKCQRKQNRNDGQGDHHLHESEPPTSHGINSIDCSA